MLLKLVTTKLIQNARVKGRRNKWSFYHAVEFLVQCVDTFILEHHTSKSDGGRLTSSTASMHRLYLYSVVWRSINHVTLEKNARIVRGAMTGQLRTLCFKLISVSSISLT